MQESKRVSTLKEVETSASQLRELLAQSCRTGALLQHSEELKVRLLSTAEAVIPFV